MLNGDHTSSRHISTTRNDLSAFSCFNQLIGTSGRTQGNYSIFPYTLKCFSFIVCENTLLFARTNGGHEIGLVRTTSSGKSIYWKPQLWSTKNIIIILYLKKNSKLLCIWSIRVSRHRLMCPEAQTSVLLSLCHIAIHRVAPLLNSMIW